ncbi:MAG TPA: S24 family peptidase, partial [Ktedonobacteraceae bacterium]|nr:S24 family peptidase [Ktedonobacteraceae bacterium]
MPQQEIPHPAVVAALFIQAVREGQSLWFRVASQSMLPLMRVDDSIYIVPARASEIRPGDIAAFETSNGLMIHRIVRIEKTGQARTGQREGTLRLLQMSDVELLPSWVKEEAVVGKVVAICRPGQQEQGKQENGHKRQVNLRHPIAKWCGAVTARIRYQLYMNDENRLFKPLLRICSRLSIVSGNAWIWLWCASRVTQ